MKNFKKISFLLSLIVLVSCADNIDNEIDLDEYGINNSQNRAALQKIMDSPETAEDLSNQLSEFVYSDYRNKYSSSNSEDQINIQDLLSDYESCEGCHSEYQTFLIELFQELITTEDYEVLEIIDHYDSQIINLDITNEGKSNLKFILFSFRIKTENTLSIYEENANNSGFWSCMRENIGRAIGEGLAAGFITGCAYGAYVGATAGTVTVPIIGTVVGAASGCVATGAASAVLGAVGNVGLQAGKCFF